METWFTKKLKKFEYDLNSLFNRVTKIHEKEFEVLPEAWSKIQDALGHISSLVAMLKTWPDLDRMNEIELEEFIDQSKLRKSEKEKLRSSPKKLDYYTKTIFWHNLQETHRAFEDFHNYIVHNQVFLSSDLQEQFEKLDYIMWSAIVERKVGESGEDLASREMRINAYKRIRDDINPIKDEIAALIQKRLHYHDVD
ncbi:MAG: hypothetical protein ACYSRR_04460 [Planctomycetota bacterium]